MPTEPKKKAIFGQDSPPQVSRFPSLIFSLENAFFERGPNGPKPLFLQWFLAIPAHFQTPPQNRPNALIRTVKVFDVSLEGGIFVHFAFFVLGL